MEVVMGVLSGKSMGNAFLRVLWGRRRTMEWINELLIAQLLQLECLYAHM